MLAAQKFFERDLATGAVLGFASLYGIVSRLFAMSGAWLALMGSCCCAWLASLFPATDAWFDPVARVAANEADGNPAAAAIGFIGHMPFLASPTVATGLGRPTVKGVGVGGGRGSFRPQASRFQG